MLVEADRTELWLGFVGGAVLVGVAAWVLLVAAIRAGLVVIQ